MKVKIIKECFEIPIGTIGTITNQAGDILDAQPPMARAMWVKFDCKEMPVGICEPFGLHVAIIREE